MLNVRCVFFLTREHLQLQLVHVGASLWIYVIVLLRFLVYSHFSKDAFYPQFRPPRWLQYLALGFYQPKHHTLRLDGVSLHPQACPAAINIRLHYQPMTMLRAQQHSPWPEVPFAFGPKN
jgi:hypothetical protein